MNRWCRCLSAVLLAAGLAATSGSLGAQAASPAEKEAAPFTLHAYANLIQVPVLVLNTSRERMDPVDPKRFVVRLDFGRPFTPTHVRQEGDDPIALAIVVDNDGSGNKLLPGVKDGIAALWPDALNPQDSLALFGVNCEVAHIAKIGYLSAGNLRRGVELALPSQDGFAVSKKAKSCKDSTHLWNAMVIAIRQIAVQPGRRVVLAVTNTSDERDSKRWIGLRDYATSQGVAIFALSEKVDSLYKSIEPDDYLDVACQMSGGMRIRTTAKNLPAALDDFITTLRERYILDFPRPRSAESQRIDIQVSLLKKPAFIRPAGVSFLIADPKVLSDPTTVPSNPGNVPEVGSRRSLRPQ